MIYPISDPSDTIYADSFLVQFDGEGRPALTHHMTLEPTDHDIRINAVSPAVANTAVYGAFIYPRQIDTTPEIFNSFHPIGLPPDATRKHERIMKNC